MPIGEYFHGAGNTVMSNMQDTYGAEKGKRVFYATANKMGAKAMPKEKMKSHPTARAAVMKKMLGGK